MFHCLVCLAGSRDDAGYRAARICIGIIPTHRRISVTDILCRNFPVVACAFLGVPVIVTM